MEDTCTVSQVSGLISKRWMPLILLALYKGEPSQKRYNELKKALKPITPKILSARLKELEQHGVVSKEMDTSTIPVRTYYTLTDKGASLVRVIKEMKLWGLTWMQPAEHCRNTTCKQCTHNPD